MAYFSTLIRNLGSFRNSLFTLGKHKFPERPFRKGLFFSFPAIWNRSGTVYLLSPLSDFFTSEGTALSKKGKPFWRFFVYSTFTAPQFRDPSGTVFALGKHKFRKRPFRKGLFFSFSAIWDRSGTVYLLSGNINFARDPSGRVYFWPARSGLRYGLLERSLSVRSPGTIPARSLSKQHRLPKNTLEKIAIFFTLIRNSRLFRNSLFTLATW